MKIKRGQVSIFVLFGLILLIAFGFIFYLNNRIDEVERVVKQPYEMLSVENSVQSCFDYWAKNALIKLGERGGVINTTQGFTNLIYKVHYAVTDEKIIFPDNNEIKIQLENYVDENIYFCIEDLLSKENLLGHARFGMPKTNVRLFKDHIIFELNPDIVFSTKDYTKTIRAISEDYDVRLWNILDISRSIIHDAYYNDIIPFEAPKFIDPNLDVNVQLISRDNVMYVLTDDLSKISGNNYFFRFVISVYKNLTGVNMPPVVQEIPFFILGEGKHFNYKINAYDPEGKDLKYSAVTMLFDIDRNGEIEFSVNKNDIGNWNIPIMVEDAEGAITTKFLSFRVEG
ncbi:hypothetical protein CMO93_02675 [Candidatus Woesearchaeota archaeon]|nr:hypothetical protein [Candidatus Woesearchaeota archaeon]|tara:strand:- start:2862 stop:3887 length:1026 start_codon:yes stop_codon:yes gene_type:complete